MRGLPQAPGDVSVASLILLTAAPRGRGTSASQYCYAGVASVLPPPEVELTHTHTHKPMFHWYKPRGSIKILGTKFIKSLISLTHKQWLYRNCDVHYISNGLTLRQHDELISKTTELMKTKRTAILGKHQHYMNTNFNTLGCGPIITCQV
jgi:hypothetical protein